MQQIKGERVKINIGHWANFFDQYQISFYVCAILLGGLCAYFFKTNYLGLSAVESVLPILLFVTFLQVPAAEITRGLKSRRFIAALIVGNFIFIPIVVSAIFIIFLFMQQLAVQNGLLLADNNGPELGYIAFILLLAPCIDYVVSFCRNAQGDSARLSASLPLLLFIQLIVLFILLNVFAGKLHIATTGISHLGSIIHNFGITLLLPLALAWLLQWLAMYNRAVLITANFCKNTVVLVTASVLFIISAYSLSKIFSEFHIGCAASHIADALNQPETYRPDMIVNGIKDNHDLPQTFGKSTIPLYYLVGFIGLYVAYACLAPISGIITAKLFHLPRSQAIATIFSVSTRNALVLLPLLLSVAGNHKELVAVIILTQTCVELVFEILYVHFTPRLVKTPE